MGMPWRALGALACLGLAGLGFALGAQWPHIPNASPPRVERLAETDSHTALIQVDGIFPQLAIETDAGSATLEHSVSALIPWSNRLWVLVSSEERTVQASGLYEVNADFKARLHQASAPGRHANRLVHQESAQAFLGPYAIDSQGTVRVIDRLVRERIAATARHLADPAHRVYHLTFDGVLFETVVDTLETRELANLKSELKLSEAFQFEFRTACSAQSRLVVGAVGDVESGRYGRKATGLLAQWDGESWSTVQECPVVDLVTPLTTVGDDTGQIPLYGVGWDDASIRLFVLIGGNWQKYRLPWGESCPPNVVSQTLRLRPFQAGHMLLSVPGLVYEVTTTGQGHFGGVVPVARNLGSYADLTFWRGLLVFAGNQTLGDLGRSHPNLWFTSPQKLWNANRPQGSGSVWREDVIEAKTVSDPYLMSAFDQKTLHLTHDGKDLTTFTVEVNFLGSDHWETYASIQVFPGVYAHHEFPAGYSAQWVRLKCDSPARVTAMFVYR